MGADITRELWEEDKKAELFTVKAPVLIEAVDTTGITESLVEPVMSSLWASKPREPSSFSPSMEAIYSIIIPPAGGEIRVEKGRANIPGASRFERPKIPDLTGYSGKLKEGKGNFPSGGLPPSSLPTRRYPQSSASIRSRRGC